MLATHDLAYRFPDGGPGFAFPNLRVGAGEAALLLGPSGSGKSTWLHLLAGVLTPRSGKMVVDGTDYAQLRGGKLDRFRGRTIGLVLQRSYFLDALTVAENLSIARRMAGLPADAELQQRLLTTLGIDRYANRRPQTLSIGQQQRVAIARALVNRPKLLLADEPTSALDRANADRVSNLLRERAAELGAALLVVTHDERLRSDFTNVTELQPAPNQV